MVIPRLGPKRAQEGAYVWRSLLESGAHIGNGTDAPVEDVSPIQCFYASVTRRMKNGETFYPEQKMTRMEALRSYTLENAYAAFEENLKGALKPGMLGDITVLSKDILTISDDELLTAQVDYTIVGGKVAYQRLK
jgi:predicted amidohydrolase YtcJ